jgi:hypothetical protein
VSIWNIGLAALYYDNRTIEVSEITKFGLPDARRAGGERCLDTSICLFFGVL